VGPRSRLIAVDKMAMLVAEPRFLDRPVHNIAITLVKLRRKILEKKKEDMK
jgi:hypothetical protein